MKTWIISVLLGFTFTPHLFGSIVRGATEVGFDLGTNLENVNISYTHYTEAPPTEVQVETATPIVQEGEVINLSLAGISELPSGLLCHAPTGTITFTGDEIGEEMTLPYFVLSHN